MPSRQAAVDGAANYVVRILELDLDVAAAAAVACGAVARTP